VPRLAIVISATGSIESLESTLVSVLENRPADCEIFVALDRQYGDPYDLKGEVQFVAGRKARLIDSVNEAIAATRAHFVHLLSSGCTVSEGWTNQALARFGDRRVAAVAPVVFDADEPTRIVAAGLTYSGNGRRMLVAHGQTETPPAANMLGACNFAAFYRRAALELVGGLCPQLGLAQADVDLACSLRQAGMIAVLEPGSSVMAHLEVDAKEAPFRQALHEERLFWRNLPKQGQLSAIAGHFALDAWDVVRSFPRPAMALQLAARTLACCQLGHYARRSSTLRELQTRSRASGESREGTRIDRSHQQPMRSRPSQAGTVAH
jgi:GT2 family glycosyltransferase